MSTVDAVLAQYEKNKQSSSPAQNKVSGEERLKKYFTTILPKGSKGEQKRIRILPTSDGTSPFKEVYFHEIQVGKDWVKLYDPKQDGKRSPLNEVYQSLMNTGVEEDRKLAMPYRSRLFYIVKVIDRDNEQDGPKFWRFKHKKNDGIIDKIFPLFHSKGDITDIKNGRDLTLFLGLTKSPTGKEYTVINSIIPEDQSPLHADEAAANAWVNDDMTWSDVYSKKPEEYLEMVAKGETPVWSSEAKKFVPYSSGEETISGKKSTVVTPIEDPQEDDDTDENLPF